jgi:zinc transport system ATP-binding protein
MAWLLEMKSLSASYGGPPVLEDVDLLVRENDFIGVIGPNGGGKTTLLKIILGLLKPLKGQIIFNNEIIRTTGIGYLPQISTGDMNYPVTVMDIILSGLMIRKGVITRMSPADRKKASAVIDELGLSDLKGASVNELSGGQMQRVFLGRAIIGEPKLLLLDEPGNFVDSNFVKYCSVKYPKP